MKMQLENQDFVFNSVLKISMSNRNFIELLLNQGCISYSQLYSDILKVTHDCYHIVERRKFYTVLNSFITCYLQFVLCENIKFNFIPKRHVNIFNIGDLFEAMSREFSQKILCKNVCTSALAQVEEPNFMNYVDRLKKFINHNSLDIDFDHLRIIKNSKQFDICANVKDNNSEDPLVLRNQSFKNKQIFAIDDFQTFLSPLKEDFTKSSKGYICQNKEVHKNKLSSIVEILAEDDLFNLSDASDTDESSFADQDTYDPVYDGIISRHFDSFKNLCSDGDFSGNGQVSDSDSDNSITFSSNYGKCVQIGYGAKPVKYANAQSCDILSSESDSDDYEMFNNSLRNKFFKLASSNINSFDELNDFVLSDTSDSDSLEICDNSSPVYQSFGESLKKEFSIASNSLCQGSIQIYSAQFDGFINPCFEDDDVILENEYLRKVNDEWEHSMQNVSHEPREPKKVSFLPMPNLVTVKTFKPDDDGYHFGLYLLNQVRFKNRIEEFEQIIKPYLSAKHRANIYESYFSDNQLLM